MGQDVCTSALNLFKSDSHEFAACVKRRMPPVSNARSAMPVVASTDTALVHTAYASACLARAKRGACLFYMMCSEARVSM